MKTINADPAQFFETGGWTFLEVGDDDSPEHGDGDTDEEARVVDREYKPPSEVTSSEDDEEHEESDCSHESTDSGPRNAIDLFVYLL